MRTLMTAQRLLTVAVLVLILTLGCAAPKESAIEEIIGSEEYSRLMKLSLDDFDQSSKGFRQHTGNYELIRLLIPAYIRVNELSPRQSRNLHWHLGQIHAFNDNYEDAIIEMDQSYEGGSVTWECYVSGSIAFLEKDMDALQESLATLRAQENQMNIEILEKFVTHFDASYVQAYNARP